MPYTLFENDHKLSHDFPTEEDAWQHAEEADLIDVVHGKKVLEDGYTIQPCENVERTPIAIPPPVDEESAG
jgi:hypothetical protein